LGGKQSVENRRNKLGEEGFFKLMKKIRGNSGLSGWHNKMKTENPELYSKIQRKRWLNLLKIWGSKEKRKKAVKSLKEKYGQNYFSLLGLNGASNKSMTKREELVLETTRKLGLNIACHKTLFEFNFDFVYRENGKIKAIEEVLGFKKKKSSIFFEVLSLYEKYKVLKQHHKVPFFVSTWYEVDLNYKIERFPLELLIWSLEKGMIPVLMDSDVFNDVRTACLNNRSFNSSNLDKYLKMKLNERKNLLEKGAAIQSKQYFDELEQKLNKILVDLGLSPEGKKLLETEYKTFVVPDNYCRINGKRIVFFVSKGDINSLIGSAALVKEFVSLDIRTVAVISKKTKKTLATKLQNILLKAYVDDFYTSLEDFESNFMGP